MFGLTKLKSDFTEASQCASSRQSTSIYFAVTIVNDLYLETGLLHRFGVQLTSNRLRAFIDRTWMSDLA